MAGHWPPPPAWVSQEVGNHTQNTHTQIDASVPRALWPMKRARGSICAFLLAFLRRASGDEGDDTGLDLPFSVHMLRGDHQMPLPTSAPTWLPTLAPTPAPTWSQMVSLTNAPSVSPTSTAPLSNAPAPAPSAPTRPPTTSADSWLSQNQGLSDGLPTHAPTHHVTMSNWHVAYKEALRRAALKPGSESDSTKNCVNGKKDWDESDLDCGGVCSGCAPGLHCFVNEDCLSGVCLYGSKCSASSGTPTTTPTAAPSLPPTIIFATSPLFPTLKPTPTPTQLPTSDSNTYAGAHSQEPTAMPTAVPTDLLLSKLGALSGGDDDDLSHHAVQNDDDGKTAASALYDHTAAPTPHPTIPTPHPTAPTSIPTASPSFRPTSAVPTTAPTFAPTYVPIIHEKVVRKWVSKAYPGACNNETCQPKWTDLQTDWLLSNQVCHYEDSKYGLRHACLSDSKRLLRYNAKAIGIYRLKYGYTSERHLVWLENTELNVLADLIKAIRTYSPTVLPTARPVPRAELAIGSVMVSQPIISARAHHIGGPIALRNGDLSGATSRPGRIPGTDDDDADDDRIPTAQPSLPPTDHPGDDDDLI
jgi:hypothetical protein